MTLEQKLLIFLIIFLLVIGGVIALAITVSVTNAKYRDFVTKHSDSFKQLNIINETYCFNAVTLYDFKHSYDNETYYGKISTKDYLIYQLANAQKKVIKSIKDAQANKELLEKYKEDIDSKCKLGVFDTSELLPNEKKLLRTEAKMFNRAIKQPITAFSIDVYLELTKINGAHRTAKRSRYYSPEILELIKRINNKSGDFYNDQEIWNAICRVERGKVTNKMRFAIYDRDGWRCRKCGARSKNLEIDHIVPIAKGGKTTMGNLQTLCHRCNKLKGDKTAYYGSRNSRW